jgi:hypothetical protein
MIEEVISYVRAWVEPSNTPKRHVSRFRQGRARKPRKPIAHRLVFDCETEPDLTQRLLFGGYRYELQDTFGFFHCVEEGLFYADDLPAYNNEYFRVLEKYAAKREQWVGVEYMRQLGIRKTAKRPKLRLLSRTDFVRKVLYEVAYPSEKWANSKPATIVGHNLPFDISRIADDVVPARGHFANGFSFRLDKRDDRHIRLAKRGAHAHIIEFTGERPSKKHAKPLASSDQPRTGKPDSYFTDTAVLTFALTNQLMSLARAGEVFNTEHRKDEAEQRYGVVTDALITYCRKDVWATADLHTALINELHKHPIELRDNLTYSPASIAKGYLDKIGIAEPLAKQPDFPREILGYSAETFNGARSECHIRRFPVPGIRYDYLSEYATINTNLGLWDLLRAKRVEVHEETDKVQRLLDDVTVDSLLRRDTWPELRGIVLLSPGSHVYTLPVRASYGRDNTHSIGLNRVSFDRPTWVSLPDAVNSKLLSGETPHIELAYRFHPSAETLDTLRPVKLRGEVEIDPRTDDFFKVVVEQRAVYKRRRACKNAEGKYCGQCQPCRMVDFLKVLANSGSYGIFVEFNRKDEKGDIWGDLYGSDPRRIHMPWIEEPGQYSFMPIGVLITGAARLMLGMIEHLVTEAGGTWVMCDTDSMFIVASPDRKTIVDPQGTEITALSYEEAEAVAKRFNSLNPYNPDVTGPIDILQREYPKDLSDGEVKADSISAKRYALFDEKKLVQIVDDEDEGSWVADNREHGLGMYLNPLSHSPHDVKGERKWATEAWEYMIRKDLGTPVLEPDWFDQIAMRKLVVSTWETYKSLEPWNRDRPYQERIKPFNFITTFAPSFNDSLVRPIAPYSSKPEEWKTMEFRDLHNPDGPGYWIWGEKIPCQDLPAQDVLVAPTFGDIIGSYMTHPESKFNDVSGRTCRQDTRGVLQRKQLHVFSTHSIGKEANDLDKRDTVRNMGEIQADYGASDEEWKLVVTILTCYGRRQIREWLGDRGFEVRSDRTLGYLLNQTSPRRQFKQDVLVDALIGLAVDLAVQDLDETDLPFKVTPRAKRTRWREILATWNQPCNGGGPDERYCQCHGSCGRHG